MNLSDLHARLEELVARIFARREELKRLRGAPSRQQLNPPAAEAEIERVERLLEIRFPDDYRAFLLMHDGWRRFDGENDLLSTEQMTSGPMKDSIRELQNFQREAGDLPAAEGVVIVASLSGMDIAFYDRGSRRQEGGMEVVRWFSGEYRRFPSFLEFLEGYAESVERRIVNERQKLRLPS